MDKKKKILVFIDWYLPGYKAGGPIQSIANMVKNLSDRYEFNIVTTNTDLNETEPYTDIEPNKWLLVEGTNVFYFSNEQATYGAIKKLISDSGCDVIYLNSLFSFKFSIVPLLVWKFSNMTSQLILAPRGMLGAGALEIKSFKKKCYLGIAKIVGIYKNIVWHVSTELEKEEVKSVISSNAKIQLALNFSKTPVLGHAPRVKKERNIRLVFLSRISPKKNLLQALNSLKAVNADIVFDIYGPIDDANYWEQCEQTIANINQENVKVKYKGVLHPKQVQEVLSNYHFFFFPTLNENFGHVIIEALSAGCPVIISDQTPWQDLEQKKAGWVRPLSSDFKSIIEKCINLNQEDYDTMSKAAYAYAKEVTSNKLAVEQHIKLFSNSTFV